MTKDTVIDGRLANPVIIARPVRFILYMSKECMKKRVPKLKKYRDCSHMIQSSFQKYL